MPTDPFTELRIALHDSGLVVVSPAPISGGHIRAVSPECAHPMRAELGMPPDTHIIILSVEDLPNWPGYTCEIVGVQEQYPFVGGYAKPASPPEAPRFTFSVEGYGAPLTLVTWRRRVFCKGTTLYLEVLWHPETGEAIAVKGLTWGTTQECLKQPQRCLKLLKAMRDHGSRPKGTRYLSREEFHAKYPSAVADVQRRRGAHTRDEDIARALGISLSTMRRYVKDYGRPVLS